MLSKILAMFKSIRTASAFAQYVDPKTVRELLKNPPDLNKLKPCPFTFVLVEFASSPELIEDLSSVADLAVEHSGIVNTIVANLAVITFGVFPHSSADSCVPFVAALSSQFGIRARAVYAQGEGQVGNLGGPQRFCYSFVHPLFPAALAALSTVAFGEGKEFVAAAV